MTIRQFQAKAEEHMEPGEYVSCNVTMSHGSILFEIWAGNIEKHFYGDSPEAALELYRCRRLDKAPIDMEISDEPIIDNFHDQFPLPNLNVGTNDVGSGPSNTQEFVDRDNENPF